MPSTHPKPRIVYMHGDGVLSWSWGWVARLQQGLHTAGFPTFFELFPDSIEARAKYRLPFSSDHVGAGAGEVPVGWSCGSVAAMRFAQDHRVRGLVLIAPYYTDLGLDAVRRSGFVGRPWPWARIKANADRIAMFHSNRDPYVAQAEFAELAQRLDARVFEITGAGHSSEQDTFPKLTDCLIQTHG
jgi:uncharacterized protein